MRALIGCLVPPAPWTGRLAGSFAAAVSILHPDGAAVSVVADEGRMEARAFCDPYGFQGFARIAARLLDESGDERPLARFSGGVLSLLASSGRLENESIDFSDAAIWDPRPTMAREYQAALGKLWKPNPVAAELGRLLESAHVAGRPREGIHAASHSPNAFSTAFVRLGQSPDFPANLVGFGPGTTPAGDDWLAGYIVGLDLRFGADDAVAEQAAKALRAELSPRLNRTTAAGRSLLLGALSGAPPAYLVRLALATLAWPSAPTQLETAVAAALGHGASSGEDAIAGFIAGLVHAGPAA